MSGPDADADADASPDAVPDAVPDAGGAVPGPSAGGAGPSAGGAGPSAGGAGPSAGGGGGGGGKTVTPEQKEKECNELVMAAATKKLNDGFANMSGKIAECSKRIIRTICQVIQKEYSQNLTKDVIANLKKYLTEFAQDKVKLEELFFYYEEETSKPVTKQEEEASICDVTLTRGKIDPLQIQSLQKLNTNAIADFVTDHICDYIKSEDGKQMLFNFVDALRRRFDIFMEKENKSKGQKIIIELLGPLASSVRNSFKMKLLTGELNKTLKLTLLERLEIVDGNKGEDEVRKMIKTQINKMRTELTALETAASDKNNWKVEYKTGGGAGANAVAGGAGANAVAGGASANAVAGGGSANAVAGGASANAVAGGASASTKTIGGSKRRQFCSTKKSKKTNRKRTKKYNCITNI
uniref:Uncharacterized protein n=1 Tax=viral metagenome TaxID=1070528 RepID=A0A6C0JMB9_9ZZZZ